MDWSEPLGLSRLVPADHDRSPCQSTRFSKNFLIRKLSQTLAMKHMMQLAKAYDEAVNSDLEEPSAADEIQQCTSDVEEALLAGMLE